MKIQISPTKIIPIPDVLTVWNQSGPGIDIQMDPKNLTFGENTLDSIFALHILDHLFKDEVKLALKNWRRCLKPGGTLYISVDDFDFVCRAYIGGDFTVEKINDEFSKPMNFNKESIINYFSEAGFDLNNVSIWFQSIPNLIKKDDYELLFSAKK